jgi:hypothetical protein
MQDEQLKKLLLSEPSPKANQEFQIKLHRQLDALSIESTRFYPSSNQILIQDKHGYWQYLVLAFMVIMTALILTHHQQTDHIDDELVKLNPMTELTLSTL